MLLLLIVTALGLGLVAGCRANTSPLQNEVSSLYDSVKSDYDSVINSLNEMGVMAIDGVGEIIDGVSAELSEIGNQIQNGELAKLTSSQLESLKETLASAQDVLEGVLLLASEEFDALLASAGDAIENAVDAISGGLDALAEQASAVLENLEKDLDALGEQAGDEVKAEYERLKAQAEKLLGEATDSTADWTKAQTERLEQEFSNLLEGLNALDSKIEAAQ